MPQSVEANLFFRVSLLLAGILCLGTSGTGVLGQPLNPQKRLTQYSLNRWDQDKGLPQNSAVAVLQTPDGYLWIATFAGLARFNGLQIQSFNTGNTPALKVNVLRRMLLATDSCLWIGTMGGGLVRYRDGTFTHIEDHPALKELVVWSLFEDSQKRIWVGTDQGLVVWAAGRTQDLSQTLGLKGETIVSLAEDSDGSLWVGTRRGLFQYPGLGAKSQLPTGSVKGVPWPVIGPNVNALIRSREGQLWVGSEKGLFRRSGRGFLSVSEPGSPEQQQITCLYEDGQGTLWVGTLSDGLYRLYNGRFDRLNRSNGLDDNQIEAVFQDREGSLWLGTYRNGVYRMRDGKFFNLGALEGIKGESVYCVLPVQEGQMLFGTSTGGVTQWLRGEAVGYWNEDSDLSSNYVRSLYRHSDGSTWIGFYGKGVNVIRDGRVVARYTSDNGLSDNFVRGIYAAIGGGIWIATRSGLTFYRDGRFQQFGKEAGLDHESIIPLEYDSYGNLWIGTEGGGLYRMQNGSFGVFEPVRGFSGDLVLALLHDPENNCVWVGTSVGLSRVDISGNITVYEDVGSRLPKGVTQMVEDDYGTLWMASNDGIYGIGKQKLLAYKPGEELPVRRFGRTDGLRNASFLPGGHPSCIKHSDGKLYFSTASGVAILDPARIPLNTIEPPVAVEFLRRGARILPANGPQRLDPSREPLEIHYTALSFISPESVVMKYRLKGFDANWVEVGQRRVAYYTNLPPGQYVFEVLAANNDGFWAKTPARIDLTIITPWFQRWWAWMLYVGGLAGLIAGFVQIRYRQLENEKERLEQQVHMRTSELLEQKAELQSAYEEIQLQMHQVERASRELEVAYSELERQNKNVTDSMEYARRIQEAILPNLAVIQTSLPKSFVHYEPRDIVSGDFYWFVRKADVFYLAVVDCTGHGVPGAFMSVMGNALLNQLVNERKLRQPADILYHLNTAVQNNLHQYDPGSTSLDGMEILLAVINPLEMHLSFASANQVLYRYRGHEFEEYKGDRYPIGGGQYGIRTFTQFEIDIELGDTFYLFTDGVADQFGGPKGRKFGYHRLKSLFAQLQIVSMREQQSQIAHTLTSWRGEYKQVDDILVIGFRF